MKNETKDPRAKVKNMYVEQRQENIVNYYKPMAEIKKIVKQSGIEAVGDHIVIKRLPPKLGKNFVMTPESDPYTVVNAGTHKGIIVSKPDREDLSHLNVGDIVVYENFAAKVFNLVEPDDMAQKENPYQFAIDHEFAILHYASVVAKLGKYNYNDWKSSNGTVLMTPKLKHNE